MEKEDRLQILRDLAAQNPDSSRVGTGGIGVVARGIKSADWLRTEMPKGEKRLLLFKIDDMDKLNFPSLGYDRRFRMPVYRPIDGAVFTTRWRIPLTTITPDGKRKSLRKPDQFQIFLSSSPRPDLEDFSSSLEPRYLSFQEMGEIENAIRQTEEIMHSKQGIDQEQVGRIFQKIEELTSDVLEQTVTVSSLQNLAQTFETFLLDEGINPANSTFKQRLVRKMEEALAPDSLGRPNKMITLTKLMSVLRLATKLEIQSDLSGGKAAKTHDTLLIEREEEREALEEAKDTLCLMIGKGNYIGYPVLTEEYYQLNPDRITTPEIDELRGILKVVTEFCLRRAKVSPYRSSAALAEVLLLDRLSRTPHEQERLAATINFCSPTLEWILSQPSAEKLIMMRKPSEARDRIRWVIGLLEALLEDEDNKAIEVLKK